MVRLARAHLPAATVIMLGIFPRHWDGGEFKRRHYAREAWPNPLAQVPSVANLLGIKHFEPKGSGSGVPSEPHPPVWRYLYLVLSLRDWLKAIASAAWSACAA